MISVIIPTHNNAAFLAGAVMSVRAQGRTDIEIIVVDDGSTDDTGRIIEEILGPDLKVIRMENGGPSAARNTGINASLGEWVAFLDADDFWLPGKLEAQLAALDKHQGAGFCYSDIVLRDLGDLDREIRCDSSDEPLFLRLLWGNRFATPTVLVRHECFDKTGLFDPQLRTGEDWDMWLRLSAYFEGIRVERPLATVRKPASSGKYPVRLIERSTMRVLEKVFVDVELHERWPQLKSYKDHVYAWHYSILAKSYFHNRKVLNFGRTAMKALMSHRSGFAYLSSRVGGERIWQ